jgi:tetratricopeptide (TPR) repeat protein
MDLKSDRQYALRPILIAALALASVTASAETEAPSDASTNWLTTYNGLRKVGQLVAKKEYKQAQAELSSSATNLPAPYGEVARQSLLRLESVFNKPAADDSSRLIDLSEVCMKLHAYHEAAQLRAAAGTKSEDDDAVDEMRAWRLFEVGQDKEAIAEYEHKLAEGQISTYAAYYTKQIELIRQRPANLTNAPFALDFVREHYLKGFEDKADLFCALKELNRALPYAKDPKEELAVYRMIIHCLSGLNDQAGRDAWEDKLLRHFKSDPDALAEIQLNRGIRAFLKKDYSKAIGFFRTVCTQYTGSEFYGDAQYNLGSAFQAQQQYDSAVDEFSKLFTSNVDDYKLVPGTSEDYKLYRHKAAVRISECYEAKKDYARALDFAELARTQYKPLSWCHTCLQTEKDALDKRIQQLQTLAKAGK